MRRWFSLLLLVLLPLQFTWAVAASYCQHETIGARHFGHHAHQHGGDASPTAGQGTDPGQKPSPSSAAEKASPGKLAADNDCGVCHLGTSNAVGDPCTAVNVAVAEVMHGLGIGAFSTRAPDHPERPKWRIA